MPYIIINDSEGKEQMRRNYKGGSWVSSGNYRNYPNEQYRTEEAYKDGYHDGWKDHEEEEFRRRNSMGRYV